MAGLVSCNPPWAVISSEAISLRFRRASPLAEGTEWLDRGANVLLFGPPGVGKSHLVCALGHALIDAGRHVPFTRCCDLVQRLQATRRDRRLPQELAKLDRFDLLVLDDLGYVRRDQAQTSVLLELIAEQLNCPFVQLRNYQFDAALTQRLPETFARRFRALVLAQKDDGYLIGMVNRYTDMRSELLVLDANHLADGPIATVRLPFKLRNAIHGTWVPGELL